MGHKITPPTVLRHGHYSATDLEHLKAGKAGKVWQTLDILDRQQADLAEIDPIAKPAPGGDWVYYPWSGLLLHCAPQDIQRRLRTNRNQDLITAAEQQQLQDAAVAIAGLSVGSGIAMALTHSGIGGRLHLADFDLLETPNLNRVQAGLADIGLPKAQITAHRIWAVDPYAQLQLFPDGLSTANLDQFLEGVAVAFDEIDDFEIKLRLRYQAKQRHTPVVMLTALGDSVLIDVERYDQQPDLPIFNGLIGDLERDILDHPITEADKKRYAAQIIGLNNVPTRAIQSLNQIGHTLVGRPQLGSTVAIEGGLGAYVARQIILGAPLASGRYRLSFADLVGLPDDTAPSSDRDAAIRQLMGR